MKTTLAFFVSLLIGCATSPSAVADNAHATGADLPLPKDACFARVLTPQQELVDLAAFHLRGDGFEDSDIEVVAQLHSRAFVKIGSEGSGHLRLDRDKDGWAVAPEPWSKDDDQLLTLLQAAQRVVPDGYVVAKMFTHVLKNEKVFVTVGITEEDHPRHLFERGGHPLMFAESGDGWILSKEENSSNDVVWVDNEEQRIATLLEREGLSLRGLDSSQSVRFEDDVLYYATAADCSGNRRNLYLRMTTEGPPQASIFSVAPGVLQRRIAKAREEARLRFDRIAAPRRPAIPNSPARHFFYDESGELQRGEVILTWVPGSDPTKPEAWDGNLRRYEDGDLGRTRSLEAFLSTEEGVLVRLGAGNKANDIWSQFYETKIYTSSASYDRPGERCELSVEAEWNGGPAEAAESWTIKVLGETPAERCAAR